MGTLQGPCPVSPHTADTPGTGDTARGRPALKRSNPVASPRSISGSQWCSEGVLCKPQRSLREAAQRQTRLSRAVSWLAALGHSTSAR